MRYVLTNESPVQVRSIRMADIVITNPTDEQIDSVGAGYPLNDSEPVVPETDPATQKVIYGYSLVDGVIVKTATAVAKTSEELIADIDASIDALNAEFNGYKDTPIMIDGRGYLPRWIYEYYNSMMLLGSAAFPMEVASTDGTATSFSFEQFQILYQTLVTSVAAYTAQANARLSELNAQKASLNGGA